MKKFILKILLILLFPSAIAITNIIIDPANIFSNDNLIKIAKYLVEKKNVANIPNFNERVFQKTYIESNSETPNTIVLGASSSLQINKHLFLNSSFFNHSVSAANIPDYISILGLYDQKDKLPERVIIGVDPHIFNKNNKDQRWISFKSDFSRMLKKLNANNRSFENIDEFNYWKEKVFELFSVKYFVESVSYLKSGGFYLTDKQIGEHTIKHYDGSLMYSRSRCKLPQETVDEKAISFGNSEIDRMSNYFKLDENLRFLFESFIKYLIKSDVEVILFLPPNHPSSYELLIRKEEYKILLEVENYIINLSYKYDLELIGSYNAENLGLSNKDFYDAVHPRREAINKIFKEKFHR